MKLIWYDKITIQLYNTKNIVKFLSFQIKNKIQHSLFFILVGTMGRYVAWNNDTNPIAGLNN